MDVRGAEKTTIRLGILPAPWIAPLVAGVTDRPGVTLVEERPAALVEMLVASALDCALLPPWYAPLVPKGRVIPGVAVCTNGPGPCQRLDLRDEPATVKRLLVAPGWEQAALLAGLTLAIRHGLPVPSIEASSSVHRESTDADVRFDAEQETGELAPALDICAEWTAQTGSPFPHALWIGRHRAPYPVLRALLSRARQDGLAMVESEEPMHPGGAGMTYHLGESEMTGLRLAFQLGSEYGCGDFDEQLVFC